MFKQIILGLCFLLCTSNLIAHADSAPITKQEALEIETFFNSYINSANNYSDDFITHYTDNAEITRVVLKPNGTKETVIIPMDRYKKELNKGKITARLVKYKNRYLNKRYEKLADSTYKIKTLRYPRNDKNGLNAEFTIIRTPNGYKISKEIMETNVQRFLDEQ